jgi:hypothetical protein
MPHYPQKQNTPPLLNREMPAGQGHDITWDRPVFRPPMLPNLRVIFDPLPFTAHRLSAAPRSSDRR